MSESVWMTLCSLSAAVGERSINAKEIKKKFTCLKLLKNSYDEYMNKVAIKTIRRYAQTAYGSNFGDSI